MCSEASAPSTAIRLSGTLRDVRFVSRPGCRSCRHPRRGVSCTARLSIKPFGRASQPSTHFGVFATLESVGETGVKYVTLKVGHIVASPRLAVDLCPWQGSACRDRDRNAWFMASGVAGEIFAARADRIWFTKHSIPRWRPHLCVGRTLCLPHQRIACDFDFGISPGAHGAIFSSAPSLPPDVPRTPGTRWMESQPAVSRHPAAGMPGLSRGHPSRGHTRTASTRPGRASYA
jgi:hypothetical protein